MSDLLKSQTNQYDDNGSLMVNPITAIENGILTNTHGADLGAIANIYDLDSTTYYKICAAQAGTFSLKWQFPQKLKFKNIYVYAEEAYGTLTIDGSNNGTDWTVLATYTATAAAQINLLASDATYKYIRVQTTGNVSQSCTIYSVKAVL